MAQSKRDIMQPIIDAYERAKHDAPKATEATRRAAITERYIASLDPVKHKAAIDAARATLDDVSGSAAELKETRLAIKGIGRVLKNHGLIGDEPLA